MCLLICVVGIMKEAYKNKNLYIFTVLELWEIPNDFYSVVHNIQFRFAIRYTLRTLRTSC